MIVVVGGIAVTVTGAGFDSSHLVKLDGSNICETQSVSLSNIICVLPAVSVSCRTGLGTCDWETTWMG